MHVYRQDDHNRMLLLWTHFASSITNLCADFPICCTDEVAASLPQARSKDSASLAKDTRAADESRRIVLDRAACHGCASRP